MERILVVVPRYSLSSPPLLPLTLHLSQHKALQALFRGLLYTTGDVRKNDQKSLAEKLFKNTTWSPCAGKSRKKPLSAQLTLVNVEKDKLVEKLETMKAEREREHEMMKAEWEREREMMKEEWEREREMMNIELKRSHEALTFEKNRGAFWESHYVRLNEDSDVVKSRNIFLEEEIAKIKTAKRDHDALEHGDITPSTNKVKKKKSRSAD
jgi:hypothetical protein